MNVIINMHYRIKETGKEIAGIEKRQIPINPGEKYKFEKERMEYDGVEYFPLYGVNNGCVASERKPEGGGEPYMKIVCSGYASQYETENNWILYYSENDPTVDDVKGNTQKAVMATNTDDFRVAVGDGLNAIDEYIEKSDAVLFDSVEILTGSMSESFYTYGSTFSPSCSITMTPNSRITAGKYIRLEFSIDGVWQQFGVFYVNTPPVMTSEQMTVNGNGLLDSVLSNMRHIDLYTLPSVPGLIRTITIPFLIERVREKTGIEIIFDFDDKLKAYNYEKNYYIYSAYVGPCELVEGKNEFSGATVYNVDSIIKEDLRELLSIFAIIFHSNVIERNGKIHITHNSIGDYENNAELFGEGDYAEEPETRLNSYYCPNEIKVKCTQMKWGNWYSVGVPVYMENAEKEVTIMDKGYQGGKPVVNYPLEICKESLWCEVTEISPTYWGNETWAQYPIRRYAETIGVVEPFIYYPIDIELIGFNPYVYAGSTIKVETNGVVRDVYVGNVTISWDGMMSMHISTPCDIEISGNSSGSSSSGGGVSSSAGAGTSASVMSSIMTGQIFMDGAITGSKIKDSTITGSKFEDGTITGSKIEDGTITGSLIAENTISGNNISKNTITGNLIKENTLTGNLIQDGTITNNLIKDSTLTGAKIQDATISFEKVDKSFIVDLTADDAYIRNLTASVADIGNLTADDAIIRNIQAVAVSADYIRATTADIGYMTAMEADLKYADITFGNIDTASIDKANIGLLFNEVGLIDRATIVDGHITGFLDAVEVNADRITAGTITTDRLVIRGKDSIIYEINDKTGALQSVQGDTLNGEVITRRTVTADKLVAKSITTNELDAENIFADSVISGLIAANSGRFIELDASQITTGVLDAKRVDATSIFLAYSENLATIDETDENTMFDTPKLIYNVVGEPQIVDGKVMNKDSEKNYMVPFCFAENDVFNGGETLKVIADLTYVKYGGVATRAFIFFAADDGLMYMKYYSEDRYLLSQEGEKYRLKWEIKIPEDFYVKDAKRYVIGVTADFGDVGVVKPIIAVGKCEARLVVNGGITTGEESVSTFGEINAKKIDASTIRATQIGNGEGTMIVTGGLSVNNGIDAKEMIRIGGYEDKLIIRRERIALQKFGEAFEINTTGKLVIGSELDMATSKYEEYPVIRLYDDGDNYGYGAELVIGANGNTYIGSGESAYSVRNAIGASTSEHMHITSDANIYFDVNCNTIANRLQVVLDSTRKFYPSSNNAGSIGTSSYRWADMYATKFHGELDGNAATANKIASVPVQASTIPTNLKSSATNTYTYTANAGYVSVGYGMTTSLNTSYVGIVNIGEHSNKSGFAGLYVRKGGYYFVNTKAYMTSVNESYSAVKRSGFRVYGPNSTSFTDLIGAGGRVLTWESLIFGSVVYVAENGVIIPMVQMDGGASGSWTFYIEIVPLFTK